MPLTLVDRAVAALVSLSPDDIASLPPAERRRLADQCRHVATLADKKQPQAKPPGILGELRNGGREE